MAMRPAGRGVRRPAAPIRQGVGVQPVYEDFKPVSEWKQEKEADLLQIYLPGFPKQNLKVSTEGQNIVRARGERIDAGNKWSRFQEDYQVPERCDITAIRARFEGGILTITMPWRKDWIHEQSKETVTPEAIPPILELPPKTSPTPDAQKQSPPILPNEPKESINPQKGFADPPKPKKSIPEKGVTSPPALTSPSKDRLDAIRPRAFDDVMSNVRSQAPLLSAGKEARTGQVPERDGHPDPPKPAVKSTATSMITKDTERKGESSQVINAGKSIKYENLESSKEESSLDNKRRSDDHKNKGVADNMNENIGKEYQDEETEKQTIATTTGGGSTDYGMPNYVQAVKRLAELKEERQLLVNVGAAALVIVALGTYIITSAIGSGEAKH